MNAGQWARMKPLFHGALDQPEGARGAWLRQAAGGDAALVADVERLLHTHTGADDFLDRPVVIDPGDLVVLPADAAGPTPDSGRSDLPPGYRVGNYEIVGTLGRGGMGVVYLAKDLRLERRVALKVLSSGVTIVERRFDREARAGARVFHPAVAAVFEAGEADGLRFIATEYVPGLSLRQLLDKGPMEAALARAVAADVTRGIDAAHTAGVLHRDLKPENIVVTEGGSAKIVDFGIARLRSEPDFVLTVAGGIIGTPAYMAPEQLLGQPVDLRADIYSLGVILAEMLSGRHPLAARPEGPPPAGDAFTRKLREVADRACQPDPRRRFASASEMVAALESVTDDGSHRVPERENRQAPSITHRWWWEFHQAAAAVTYGAMLVPAWLARGVIGESEGRGFFIATVSAAVMAGMLRLHLWFMSRQHPDQLRWARQRSRHWVRMADVLFALSLLIGAGLLVGRSSLDVVLLVMAIGVAIAAAVIEPATARAAGLDDR